MKSLPNRVPAFLMAFPFLFLLIIGWPAPARAQCDCAQTGITGVNQIECEALVALYNSTNGPGWTDSTNWNTTSPVTDWFGVSTLGMSIVAIDLANNNLSGTLPVELGNLSGLEILSLYSNQLSGEIPSVLGNLSALRTLWLDRNRFGGPIPPALGNLANLEWLDLYSNQLSGSIPPAFGNLASLQDLRLFANRLSGDIPIEITNLAGLTALDLGYNQLTSSDTDVLFFLAMNDMDWEDTQTIPPSNLFAGFETSNSIDLNWMPIPYTGDGGYYTVYYGTTPGGPYPTVAGNTLNKFVSDLTVTGLSSNTTYYFVVETFTPAHAPYQQNDLTSSLGSEVSATTSPAPALPVWINIDPMDGGSVSSSPPGIDCPIDCDEEFTQDQLVSLTAVSSPGYQFDSWEEGLVQIGAAENLDITVDEPRFLTAVFTPVQQTLTVAVSPVDGGSVDSFMAGIACPNDCSESYSQGELVLLTATDGAGYIFDRWEGDQTGTDPILSVSMDTPISVTAVFVPATYMLNVAISPANSGEVTSMPFGIVCPSVACAYPFANGSSVTLDTTPAAGYQFARWEQDLTGTNPSPTLTMNADMTVTAVFEPVAVPRNLTVAVSPVNAGQVVSTPSGIDCPGVCTYSFEDGSTVTLGTTPAAGYQFARWEQDLTGTNPSPTLAMDSDLTVTAVFEPVAVPRNLTVAVSPVNAGQVVSTPSGIDCPGVCVYSFEDGSSVTLDTTPAAGYQFARWEQDLTGTNPSPTLAMDSDLTVTAVFEPVAVPRNLTVAVSPVNAGQVVSTPSGIDCPGVCTYSFEDGSTVTLGTTPASGYQFARWEQDLTGTNPSPTLAMDSDLTVTAVFETVAVPRNLTVAVSPINTGQVVSNPYGIDCPGVCAYAFEDGSQIALDTVPAQGWQFARWEQDLTGTNPSPTLAMNSDLTVTAVFEAVVTPRNLTVSVSPINTGQVLSNPYGIDCPGVCAYTFEDGSPVTLDTVPATGYQFARWEQDITGTDASPAITMDSDMTVTAVFEPVLVPRSLTVAVSPTGAGQVLSNPYGIDCPGVCAYTFEDGSPVTLDTVPATGYQFARWEQDITGTDASPAITMDSDMTVTAVFEPVLVPRSLTVAVSPTDAGQVLSNPYGIDCPGVCAYTFEDGSQITLDIVPAQGYRFARWEQDITGTDASPAITMDSDMTVTAVFEPVLVPRNLTVAVSPENTGQVVSNPYGIDCPGVCAYAFEDGSQISLNTVPAQGFQFARWEQDLTGTDASPTLAMDSDMTVTAVFEPVVTPRSLMVVVSPYNAGEVLSDPFGIDCPETECGYQFEDGSQVRLDAIPARGWQFVRWEQDLAGTDTSPTLVMNSDKTVAAVFEPLSTLRNLSVAVFPEEAGEVLSDPYGIDCPGVECAYQFEDGSQVALDTIPARGWQFVRWEQDLAGTDTSPVLEMDSDKSVTAVFEPLATARNLTVAVSPENAGEVLSEPYGIDCPEAECTHRFEDGTQVRLDTIPAPGWQFVHWEQDLAGTDTSPVLEMDSDKNVTAVFEPFATDRNLTVAVFPEYAGEVLSEPYGIDCPRAECQYLFRDGSQVRLDTFPAPGWQFVRWEQDLAGTDTSPALVMNSNKTVTAVFSSIGTITISIEPKSGGLIKVFEVDRQTGNIAASLMTCPDVCKKILPIGAQVTLAPESLGNSHFSYWQVNGRTLMSAGLSLVIEEDTRITAVFGIDGIPDDIPAGSDPRGREDGGGDAQPDAGEDGGGCFMESLPWQVLVEGESE